VIVLDTNILSELMQLKPAEPVYAWVDAQPQTTLCTTSINKAEIMYGIGVLPEGGRRSALAMVAAQVFEEDFEGRVLPFDDVAAAHYADIVVSRRRKGRPIEAFDAMIAAIARAAGAEVATRDVNGFADCGLTLINPWTA
jgi:predicted nucleic acid-binding protein